MEVRCINCKNYYNDMFEVCPHCGYVEGVAPEETFLLYPGVVLKNRYEIGMVLGYGGFGAIYKAWDTKLETSVAVKEYFQSGVVNRIPGDKKVFVFSDKKQVEYKEGLCRFLEEARNTVKFSRHDNIVNVYDYFEENGTAYIVMEYLQGHTLKDILFENGGSLDVETSLKIFGAALRALKAVHAEDIIHRDVSPDNIFLTDSGKIKLIDFGAARFAQKNQENKDVVVKPGFAPPEQYRAKGKQGDWTDIYAIGATMYRILTGVTPQESVSREEKDALLAPNEIQPVIPEFLSSIIMKCMNLEPELRFQNVEQLERALRKGQIVKSRKKQIRNRKKRRFLLCVMILIVFSMLGMAVSLAYDRYIKVEKEKPVELSIWLKAEEENIEEELAAFEKLTAQFEKTHPNVQLHVFCYGEAAFEQKIVEAKESGEMPELYESTGMSAETMTEVVALNSLYKDINKGTYGDLLEKYIKERRTQDRIPLTCNISVVYDNILLEENGIVQADSLLDFVEGKGKSYVGGVDCYLKIREAKLGEYSVSAKKPYELKCDNYISINADIDRREKKQALQFVKYLLGQQAQEILCIDYSNGFPVNQAAGETFFEIYNELAILRQGLENYSFDSEENQ